MARRRVHHRERVGDDLRCADSLVGSRLLAAALGSDDHPRMVGSSSRPMVGPSRAAVTASKPECKRGSHDGVLVGLRCRRIGRIGYSRGANECPSSARYGRRGYFRCRRLGCVALESAFPRLDASHADGRPRYRQSVLCRSRSARGHGSFCGNGGRRLVLRIHYRDVRLVEPHDVRRPRPFGSESGVRASTGELVCQLHRRCRGVARAGRAHLTLRAGCPGDASPCFPATGGGAGDRRPRKLGITCPRHRVRGACRSARFSVRLP